MIFHGFGSSRASKMTPCMCLILTIDPAFKSSVGIKIPPQHTLSKHENHIKKT